MLRLRIAAIALAALAAAGCHDTVLAQTAPDPVGEWHGALETPRGKLTLVVYFERADDGTLTGELESPDQAPGKRTPLTALAVEGGHMEWKVAPIAASYEGDWAEAEQQWQGTFSQGLDLPLALSQGAPAAKPVIEGLDGTWRATVEMNGAKLRQVLHFSTGDLGTIGTYDSPDQMANGLAMQDLARDGQQVSFKLFNGLSVFEGTLSEDLQALTGTFTANNQSIAVSFARDADGAEPQEARRPQLPQEPFPYAVEEVAFDNPQWPDVHLAGSLTLPEGEGPFPAAVMITGSGAQDRDETLMGHKPFAVIADYLTRRGIAVLRFDDRGVGGSTGDYSSATSADLATDANAAFAYLRGRTDIDPGAIGFIGHSEGGMIGPIAMADNPYVAYLVMLAGPGTALDKLLLSQRRLMGATMGMSEEQMASSEPVVAAMFAAIAEADTEEAGLEAAKAKLTPEAMKALGAPDGVEIDKNLIVGQIANKWFRFFLRYDPVPNLQRIAVPVLALNGSLDLQVPATENLPAIGEALKHNPEVTLVTLPGLNHLFQHAGTGGIGEYATIEETFAPEALQMVGDWIEERFGK